MPVSLPALPRRRIIAIDAMRGLTFFIMLFVNCLAGARGIPYGIQHMAADVDGMSLADVVFPGFLFVVGMSIPFSLQYRLATDGGLGRTLWQVASRALGLIVIGLFMVNAEENYNQAAMGMSIELWSLCFYGAAMLVWGSWSRPPLRAVGIAIIVGLALVYRSGADGRGWMDTSWWGILGCIGWAYLATSVVYLFGRGRAAVLAASIVACVAWFIVSHACGGNEVIAMHATHTSMVLCGALCVLVYFDGGQAASGARRMKAGALLGLSLALCAAVLHHWYPISKIGATPPWALYCAAICCGLFVLVYWLTEVRRLTRWTALVQPAATNPLMTYLLPVMLAALMRYLHLAWLPVLTHGATAIAFAVLFAAVMMALVALLNTYNVKLKL